MKIINLIVTKIIVLHLRSTESLGYPVDLTRSRDCAGLRIHFSEHPLAWKSYGYSGIHERVPEDGNQDQNSWPAGSVHVTRAYRYRMRRNTQHDAHAHTHAIYKRTPRTHYDREASIYGAVLALTVSPMFNLYERAGTGRYPIRWRYSSKTAVTSILSAALNTRRAVKMLFASGRNQFLYVI